MSRTESSITILIILKQHKRNNTGEILHMLLKKILVNLVFGTYSLIVFRNSFQLFQASLLVRPRLHFVVHVQGQKYCPFGAFVPMAMDLGSPCLWH